MKIFGLMIKFENFGRYVTLHIMEWRRLVRLLDRLIILINPFSHDQHLVNAFILFVIKVFGCLHQ